MAQRQIYPLFSTPVYINNLGPISHPDLTQLEYTHLTPAGESYNFLSSVDKNVLELPQLGQIRQLVQGEIEFCARELHGITPEAEFYITNSWINIYGKGDQAGAHVHHNSLLSGVLYLQTSDAGGEIVFHKDLHAPGTFPLALDPEVVSSNLYNCKSWGYRPQTGDICIFPSYLSHSVQPNLAEQARWSLAFNVFIRGRFGAIHRLHLK